MNVPIEEHGWPVVAAVIADAEGAFLVGLRPAHKRHGGYWEFPGGKLDPGETFAAAAARELWEELGVVVTGVGQPLLTVRDPGSSFAISFIPVRINGTPVCREHDAVCWASLGQLAALPLAPTDAMFVRAISSGAIERASLVNLGDGSGRLTAPD